MARKRVFSPDTRFAECNGYGMIDCYCGGDLCVCGLDGSDCLLFFGDEPEPCTRARPST